MAFLVDPTARSIRAVALEDLPKEIFEGKDAILMDADTGDVLFESAQGDGYCVIGNIRRPLKGVICVVGTSQEGDDIEPTTTYEWLVGHTDFGTASGGIYYGDTIVRSVQ